MALIKCPKCSGEMSSLAASCPHCGRLMNDESERLPTPVVKDEAYDGDDEYSRVIRMLERRNIPTCPVCHSTNLSRISAAKSFLKIAAIGIAGAGDVGKTWKCNNCGSKF